MPVILVAQVNVPSDLLLWGAGSNPAALGAEWTPYALSRLRAMLEGLI